MEIHEQQKQIDGLREDMIDVKTRLAVAESNIREMRQQLIKIDSNTTWTVRLVMGAILLGIINVVLNGGGQ
jgi:hypothetical protein